jgi:hypothetical protein
VKKLLLISYSSANERLQKRGAALRSLVKLIAHLMEIKSEPAALAAVAAVNPN